MRLVVVFATLAVVAAPSIIGAQSLPLTESEALARLSPASARVRAIRSSIDVARAEGHKCARCWRMVDTISSSPDTDGLCDRCVDAVGGSRAA